jgi:hypothetical protein
MAWGSSSTLPRRALVVVVVATGVAVSGEGAAQSAAGDDGVTLAAPPTAGENAAYPGHRAPLAPDPLIKLPVGAVKPRGWLEQQLQLMASGMFGRIPEVSRWVRPNGSAWRSRDGSGDRGWEELPYWLKGFTSLAHLAKDNDRALVSSANGWIEAILAAQRDDGYFGPEANRTLPDLWPNMPVLWALRTHFEATGDARVLEFLKRYFRYELALPREKLLPDSWQKVRGGDNLEIVHWLYDQTGEAWLLELAQAIHDRTADWTGSIASWHGVNFCQGFREPLQFGVQSKEERHRAATPLRYAEMMERFGQVPGGMFGADENCRPGCGDPRQAAEACSMVEFMASFELLAGITGDPVWADRCEEVAFNSLPAAVAPDMKALHYLTAPNCVACDAENHAPEVENEGCMFAFSPDARYRCCQHDVVQGWPYFAEHCWMATRDGGLAALLWAPCEVTAKVGDGGSARVRVTTDYPLSDRIEIEVEVAAAAPRRFPIYLRIPGWCRRAKIVGLAQPPPASSWVRIERTWKGTATIVVELPMDLHVRRFPGNHDAAAVACGPLTYSLALVPEWSGPADHEWGAREVTTRDPWNYALALEANEPERSFQRVRSPREVRIVRDELAMKGAPAFEPKLLGMPVRETLVAKGRRLPAWQLEHGLVAPLQESPVRAEGPDETLLFVPMGACYVRMTAFPVLGAGRDAHDWSKPGLGASASHVHDLLRALDDGVLPVNSADTNVARFTWWDHVGTVEWVEYDFEQPRRIGRSGAYWYDDGASGRCRVPQSWRVLWFDESKQEWREVAGVSKYGVARDRINLALFDAVTTKRLRLEATLQPNFSGGLLEWTAGEPIE